MSTSSEATASTQTIALPAGIGTQDTTSDMATEYFDTLQPVPPPSSSIVSTTSTDSTKSHLTCPVCYELLYKPRISTCGHTLCYICSQRCRECPTCRRPAKWTSNLTIQNLIQALYPEDYNRRGANEEKEMTRVKKQLCIDRYNIKTMLDYELDPEMELNMKYICARWIESDYDESDVFWDELRKEVGLSKHITITTIAMQDSAYYHNVRMSHEDNNMYIVHTVKCALVFNLCLYSYLKEKARESVVIE
jgi:hypothetical protein